MVKIERHFRHFAAAALIGVIAVMLSTRPAALPAPHNKIAAIRAGAYMNCEAAKTQSYQACVACQSDGNGAWVKCDMAEMSSECVTYQSPTECIECMEIPVNCTGDISRYSDDQCMMLIKEDFDACMRTYTAAADQACMGTCP